LGEFSLDLFVLHTELLIKRSQIKDAGGVNSGFGWTGIPLGAGVVSSGRICRYAYRDHTLAG
jgi:hypothetical protein